MRSTAICLGVCALGASAAQADEIPTRTHLITKRAPFVMSAMGVQHEVPGYTQSLHKVAKVTGLPSSAVRGALRDNPGLSEFIKSTGTPFDLYYMATGRRSYPEGTSQKVLNNTRFDGKFGGTYVVKLATPYKGRRYWKIGHGQSEGILTNAGVLWKFDAFDGLAGRPAPPYWPPLKARIP